ncbi:MAG: hypothetical protein LBD93_06825 [Treponema sp.]|jgi:hypothetical protein|nr:hypothetical protein [Treponema sp.]
MIKTMSAYTFEIDEVAIAVSEILAQLDVEHSLYAHSVGLMTCYEEFIETRVIKAISDALPFDVIGCSTMANASAGELEEMMLCLYGLHQRNGRAASTVGKDHSYHCHDCQCVS